jgi:HD superfamily phosphohydrolase
MVSKLDKEYKVRDLIYGFVKLNAQEMDIVNSPAFQRLRRIKQLALTDMVYPGASHTRFEHSLGVVQMATEMFDNIVSKESNLKRLQVSGDGLERIRKIIRLAALLHDIGHAPFSHTGEESMPLLPQNHPRYKSGDSKRYGHEDYSIAIIRYLYKELIENHQFGEELGIKVEDVTALLGDESVRPTRTTILWKGLISGQLDADRADYLLRDSLHIGVNYGIYDRHRLVNCVTIGESEESDCFLAIEEGGWHVAESLVIARYQMFSQVYFHRVRRAFDYHVGQATKEVLKKVGYKDGLFPKPISSQNIGKYLEFDDWKMCGAFKNSKGGSHGDVILRREPYKCKMMWDRELTEIEKTATENAINQYGGCLDNGATTWYTLDKDILIFNEKTKRAYPLSYKSKLIEKMPGLPKEIRLYINLETCGADYEFTI